MSGHRDSRLAKERLAMDGARYTWLSKYCVKVMFEVGGGDLSGGRFEALMSFPEMYPFHPPTVRFVGPMWHVHVNERGRLVCDMLDACWSPALSPTAVVLSVESLLNDPDTQGLCCGRFVADMYRNHNHSFRAVAHWFAQRHGGARVAPLPMVPGGEKTWLGYIAEAAPKLPSELCEAVLSYLFYRDPSLCVARAAEHARHHDDGARSGMGRRRALKPSAHAA